MKKLRKRLAMSLFIASAFGAVALTISVLGDLPAEQAMNLFWAFAAFGALLGVTNG